MSIAAVSSATAATTTSSTASSSTISSDDFLQLLVKELENQNPLDPTDTNSFMTQLMSYANFSSQQTLNSELTNLVSSFNGLMSSSAVSYMGHTVEAKGDTATLSNGQATWGYSLNSDAANVSIIIKDSNGATVWTGTGETTAGKHTLTWDGKTSDGTQLADGGQYTIEISATDSSGASVYGYTTTVGIVDGIDSSSSTTMLDLNGVEVSLADVVGIRS